MEPFRILIVDDDPVFVTQTRELLSQYGAQLTESISRTIGVDVATTQEEADAMILAEDAKTYELVLLDLRYPRAAGREVEKLAIEWLPILRKARPDVVVAVLTAYGNEDGLHWVVRAFVEGDADEFIPKGVPWREMLARLKTAIRHRRDSRRLAATANPLLSNVARTSSEDIHCALNRARAQLQRLGSSADGSADPIVERVNQVFESLQAEIDTITARVVGRIDRTASEVKCCGFVAEQALIFEAQLRSSIPIECIGDCRVLTYPEDLRIAVLELLQNAADAVVESNATAGEAVSVRIVSLAEPKGVSIEVRDRGPGFAPAALDTKFTPGSSFWTRDSSRHRGMGLYVARRMMHSIGGDLEILSAEGRGTAVRLTVRDWGAK